jgi:hypothetical protein
MDPRKESQNLEEQLARYRRLLREFPDGDINAAICDLIEETEQRLRDLSSGATEPRAPGSNVRA